MTRLQETELPEKEASKREHGSEPYPSPTHAGGLFAINRDYFLSLGAYDPGEHLPSFGELSRCLLLAIKRSTSDVSCSLQLAVNVIFAL